MKIIKITLVVIILIVSQFANAQSKSDKMYDVFSGNDGVSSFSFSKSMIDAIDLDLGDDDDEKNVTGDLNRIRFMSYNPEEGNLAGSDFIKKAIGLLPSQYNKFEDESGDDEDVEIWLLGKKKKFTECHVFVKNDDDDQMRFIISFYGDFNVNDLDNLREKGKGFSDN